MTAARVEYSVAEGPEVAVVMTPTANADEFAATIPGFGSPNSVRWHVSADSSVGNTVDDDDDGMYHHGTFTVIAGHDFDGATDEGWFGVVSSGGGGNQYWDRVDPAISPEYADPYEAYSPPNVFGLVLDPSGGLYPPGVWCELRSQPYDFTNVTGARLQYRRWLSVAPNDIATLRLNNFTAWQPGPS